ncbi:APC family permease [Motilibacter deserti]|uniref:Amino acid permease n=1 Tax=Motilibacter deserti TaxID=2714956 RepID=A0ABX0GQM5_9ACTN|nr:APC family permease [Motilibacter deserti]NHC13144.1 amino acid permease [Motilibacter deserti]
MSMLTTYDATTSDDAARLRLLGYEQQLRRSLGMRGNLAIGFATISPVVGLYGVAFVGLAVAGGLWVWALPVALAGQACLVSVYAELAARFPVAGGAYQWTRRVLPSARYAWMTGWLSLCAFLAANTTIAYLAAPWVWAVLGGTPGPALHVATAAAFLVACSVANTYGIEPLRRLVSLGIAAEIVASVVVGLVLLLAFREQGFSVLTDSFGTEAAFGGSSIAAGLAVLAVAGWAFLGMDACVASSEETRDAARHVPRAVWAALLSVGAIVVLDAVAVTLAHPDPALVPAGADVDPVTTAVTQGFGGWATKPFAVLVLVAFLACGLAAQGATARMMWSMSRDEVLPGSRALQRLNRHQAPVGAIAGVTLVGGAGLLLGLDSTAMGSLLAFGTAVAYLVFLLIAVAALLGRLAGTWAPAGGARRARRGLVLNVAAVAWLGFEFVNVAWPRAQLAPPGAPWYQVWAAVLVTVLALAAGTFYLLVARPHRRVACAASFTSGVR